MTRPTWYPRWGKRAFDLLVGSLALGAFAPVMIVTAILVRLLLGSPVLFRQTRSGFKQNPFTILKFRTMTDARGPDGELLADTARLTRFGRFLRKTSLDELPELLNVIKGDMSLIGPRPLITRYDNSYHEHERKRFEAMPGITGWAQVNGRNGLGWNERFAFDVWYVERRGLLLDAWILLRTIWVVVRRENIHEDTSIAFLSLDEERGPYVEPMQAAKPINEGRRRANCPLPFASGGD